LATHTLVGAAVGNVSTGRIHLDFGVAITASVVWLAFTAWLFRVIEKRLRANGRLQTG